MQVLVNPDGTRDRSYRPYIDQEETIKSTTLYDPTAPFHYGLYDTSQPVCNSFQNHFNSSRKSLVAQVLPNGQVLTGKNITNPNITVPRGQLVTNINHVDQNFLIYN